MRHTVDPEFVKGFLSICFQQGFHKEAATYLFRQFIRSKQAQVIEGALTDLLEKKAVETKVLPGAVPGVTVPAEFGIDPSQYFERQQKIEEATKKHLKEKPLSQAVQELSAGQTIYTKQDYLNELQKRIQQEKEENSPIALLLRDIWRNNPLVAGWRGLTGGTAYQGAQLRNWWREQLNKLFGTTYYEYEKVPPPASSIAPTYRFVQNPVLEEYKRSRQGLERLYSITPEQMQEHLRQQEILRAAGYNPYDPAAAARYRETLLRRRMPRYYTPPYPALPSYYRSPLTGQPITAY